MPAEDSLLDEDEHRDNVVKQFDKDFTTRSQEASSASRQYHLSIEEGRTRHRTTPGTVSRTYPTTDLSFGGLITDEEGADPTAPIAPLSSPVAGLEGYLSELEEVYDEYGENIPLSFFLQYDPEDLQLFHKEAGLDFDKGMAEILHNVQMVEEFRETRDEEVEQTYLKLRDEDENQTSFWRNMTSFVFGKTGGRIYDWFEGDPVLSPAEHNKLMEEAKAIVEGKGDLWHAEEIVDKMINVGDFTFQSDAGVDEDGNEIVREEGDELFRTKDSGAFWRDWSALDGNGLLETLVDQYNPFDDDRTVTEEVRASMIAEVAARLAAGQSEAEIRHGDNWSFRFGAGLKDAATWVLGEGMQLVSDNADNPASALNVIPRVLGAGELISNMVDANNGEERMEAWDEYYDKFTIGGLIADYAEKNPDSMLWDGTQWADARDKLDEFDEAAEIKNLKVANYTEAENLWREHVAGETETYQAFMQMGGLGDVGAAFTLFAAAVLPDEGEQLEYVDSLYEDAEARLESIREANGGDFALTAPLLNALAAYGKAVPMTFAVAGTALAAEDEFREDLKYASSFGDMYDVVRDRASEANYSPAAVLGYDGTVAGLVFDLSAGALADPMTWIFGPTAKAGSLVDPAMARNIATKGLGRVWADDVGRIAVEKADSLLFQRQTVWMGKYADEAFELQLSGASADEISKAIQAGAEQAMLNGHKNPLAGKSALALRAGASMRRAFTRLPGESIEAVAQRATRLMTPQTTARRLHAGSPNFYEDVITKIETVAGLDPKMRENYLRRVFEVKARERGLHRTTTAEETATRIELDMVEDSIERIGAWDDQALMAVDDLDPSVQSMLDDMVDEGNQAAADQAFRATDETQGVVPAEAREVANAPEGAIDPTDPRLGDTVAYEVADLSEGNRLASTNLETGRVRIDRNAIEADWDEGVPYLRGEKGENSANQAQILDELGIDPDDLMEELGSAEAYAEFIHNHEKWHVENPGMTGYEAEKAATQAALRKLRGMPDELDPTQFVDDLNRAGSAVDDLGRRSEAERALDELKDNEMLELDEILGDLSEEEWIQQRMAEDLANETNGPRQEAQAALRQQQEATTTYQRELLRRLEDRAEELRNRPVSEAMQERIAFDRGVEMQTILDELYDDVFFEEGLWKTVTRLVDAEDLRKLKVWEELKKLDPDADIPRPEVMIYWEELGTGPSSWGGVDDATRRQRKLDWQKAKKEGKDPSREWLVDDLDIMDEGEMAMTREQYNLYSSHANRVTNVQLKASPYMLAAARSGSPQVFNRILKTQGMMFVRKALEKTMQLWMFDKLIGPRTAAVVSFDEMMRIYSRYGFANTVGHQWKGARARAARKHNYKKAATSEGERRLMQAIDDSMPDAARMERAMAENALPEWTPLHRGDNGVRSKEFDDAARRVIAGNMNDSGFRAYLKGREAFDEWWETSADANKVRANGPMKFVDDAGNEITPTKHIPNADEIWNMYENVFPILFNGKQNLSSGMNIRTALKKIVDDVEAGRQVSITNDILESVDSVMAAKQTHQLGDRFFDSLFSTPLQRRRSLIYRLESQLEEARLAKLFSNQKKFGKNRVILPDAEIARRLNIPIDEAVGFRESWIEHIMETSHYVPEGHISRLTEQAANDAMDRMLYGWDSTSAFNRGMKHIAPFYGPWEDMWKFWFKEIGARPYIRGNNPLVNGVGKTLSLGGHVNPKPLAMASRLAATDFSLDKVGEEEYKYANLDPFNLFGKAGISEINASSLLFLPTAGNNPAGTMLPQPGPVPMWVIDYAMYKASDDDPTEWRQLVSSFAGIFPGAGFSRGVPGIDAVNRLAGGGLLSRTSSALANAAVAHNPDSVAAREWQATNARWINDWSHQSLAAQSIRSELANGEVNVEDLLAEYGDDLEAMVDSLVVKAESRAARQDLVGNDLASWLMPASTRTGVITEEVENIWIEAGTANAALFGPPPDAGSPKGVLREYADRVRNSYFKDLSEEEQLVALVKYPQIAVNLISGWEWTDAAEAALGSEALSPYRTGATNKDRNRHQQYLNKGYIRHIDGDEYAWKVLETAAFAKERLASKLFEQTFQNLNTYKWDKVVTNDTKRDLQEALSDDRVIFSKLGINDEEELWRFFGSFEDENERHIRYVIEETLGGMRGLNASERTARKEEANEIYKAWIGSDNNPFKIPVKERAFATAVPSATDFDTGRITDTFGNGAVDVLFKTEAGFRAMPEWGDAAMRALGLQMGGSYTTSDLYDMVKGIEDEHAAVKGSTSLATSAVSAAKWIPTSTATQQVAGIRDNYSLPESTRSLVNDFVAKDQLWTKRYEHGISMDNADKLEMRNLYNKIKRTAEGVLDWDETWEMGYARRYGDLDFEVPKAPKLYEDGSMNPNAFIPTKVLHVNDGDTITIHNAGENWNSGAPLGNVKVRLIGADSAEMNTPAGKAMRRELLERLMEARTRGEEVALVMDPDYTGYEADHYGRVLAWLYIGGVAYTTGIDGFIPQTGDQ